MTADQPPVATSGDYRLADFKPLLPLGDGVRALVIATRERDFLPYLAADLGGIDLVDAPAAQAAADAAPQIWPESLGIRSLAEPAGPYDLVLSDQPSAARHLRPGGILCLFLGTARDSAAAPAELTALGQWRALPSWPAFRALVPDDGRGWRAATRDLHLLSVRAPAGIAARLRPGLAGRLLAERGIALYRRTGGAPAESLLAGLQGALAPQADAAPERRWLLASGRLGPGNPILAFRLDEQGRPDYLIKIARFAGATHLQSEAEQL
ncbi:hypothetical protein, partial [Thiococcus pfennigii]|uniref:hypothetical protein n=1 Tax=Thiococcus pfennigii TaxID=1057 RepID=UPI001904AF1F